MGRVPLPPLPPLAVQSCPAGPDLLDLLDEEHEVLAALCARLAAGDPVGSVLTATLSRHLSAEEQYLYPAVRAVLSDGGALADAESAALRAGADPASAVPAHIDRCERSIFPPLRAALDGTARIRLGNRAVIAAEAAPTRPHPWTPRTPPWNKLVDPLVGAVDKVRDAATGRATRVGDLRKAGGGERAGT